MRKIILTSLLLINSISFADSVGIKKEFDKCLESDEALSTWGFIDCSNIAYDSADKELNVIYKKITQKLSSSKDQTDKEVLRRFVNAQKAWVNYKEASCSLAGVDMIGGSGERLIISGCLTEETITQLSKLEKFEY